MSINNSFNEPLENVKFWKNLDPIKSRKIDTPGDIVAIFLEAHSKNTTESTANLPSLEQVFKLIVNNKETLKNKPNLKSLEALYFIMFHLSSLVKDQRSTNLIDDLFLNSLSEIILPHFMLRTNSWMDKGKKDSIQASLAILIKLMPKDNLSETTLAKVSRLRSVIIPD